MRFYIFMLTIAGLMYFQSVQAQEGFLKPTPLQLNWQENETTAFLHFSINTFTGKEWGDGTESPQIFNPVKFDARQWVKALKDAGFKIAIITAKHHDGFCLWPTNTTDHSVKNSPWKNGKGDVVKEVADACKEFGVAFGFYLSPWDRHEKSYGTPAYNEFYKKQLKELLTNYGEVAEVWFDGAKGKNEKDMVYDFDGYWKMVREMQPKAIIFSGVGPDARWVGNENGNAGDTCWSTINTDGMMPGNVNPSYLNKGDEHGKKWIPAETDVSIRPGWFWHEKENNQVRSAKNLVNLYYQSVGRNSLLLLNIPPNKDGLFEETDIRAIDSLRNILNETFAHNLVKSRTKKELTDKKISTCIALKVNEPLVINLGKEQIFDRLLMQENIENGQSIKQGLCEYWDGSKWQVLKTFSTIGYKRLLRFNTIKSSKVRLTILQAKINHQPQLSEVGVYKASAGE
ncbi:alpha-L-fucosidase [Chitinophagaceae bacterium LB-8]|uniref:alpha-L-fucosidase n=1 Tax=Paraflavisolibacter caeni TaxID=2982496 RepID=A0A9X2XU03_9BACT|nr:alpha-L-fucosidase [Paraflavisolibacter caeni]MCU7548835.1 alpha-L-fucosidase [Paraflavisolibacter caeni]